MPQLDQKTVKKIWISKKVFIILLYICVVVLSSVFIIVTNPYLTLAPSLTQILRVLVFPVILIVLGTRCILSVAQYFITRDPERKKKKRKSIWISLVIIIVTFVIFGGLSILIVSSGIHVDDFKGIPYDTIPTVVLDQY